MNPVSVFEAYLRKVSHSLLFTKKLRKLDVYWKIVFQWILKTIESTTFNQYLDCHYNEYPVKQTPLLYLKFPLKPAFFSVFLLLMERYFFTYFKLIYFWISRSNSSRKGDEGGIFSKAPDWNPLWQAKSMLPK